MADTGRFWGIRKRPSKPMFPSRIQGIARLHFILQMTGALLLLWVIFPVVNWLRFDWGLANKEYIDASFILIAAALMEYFTRSGETRVLAGLSKQQLSAVGHRQTLFALVSIFGTMVMMKDNSLSRIFLSAFFASYFLWIAWSNRFGYRMLHRLLYRNQSKGHSRTLLIGSPLAVSRYCDSPPSTKPPGTDILGYIAVGPEGGTAAVLEVGVPRIGVLDDLRAICEETKTRALLLLGLTDRMDLVSPLTRISSELGLRTMWLDDVNTRYGSGSQVSHTGNYSVVTSLREPLEDPVNRAMKRMLDILVSTFGVIFILPAAMLFVALLHRFRSPGPLFYNQARSGRNGEAFQVLKFRSMDAVKEEAEFEQAKQNDPRVFAGGDFIRKMSIDELPQLINVFRGEMSLVGPRPHPLGLDDRLALENRVYRLRNLAKPGITGLAQSRGWRGETRNAEQVRNRIRLDLFYIQHWSLGLDLRILVETVWQVIRPPGSAC